MCDDLKNPDESNLKASVTSTTTAFNDDIKPNEMNPLIANDALLKLASNEQPNKLMIEAVLEKLFQSTYETMLVEKLDSYKKSELEEMKEKIMKLEQRNVELEKILSSTAAKHTDSQNSSFNNSGLQDNANDDYKNFESTSSSSANHSAQISNFMNNQIVMPSGATAASTNLAFQSNTSSNLIIQNNSTNNLVVHNKVNFMHAPQQTTTTTGSNTSSTSTPVSNQNLTLSNQIPNIHQGGYLVLPNGNIVYLPPMNAEQPQMSNSNNVSLVTSTPSKLDMNIGQQRNQQNIISPNNIAQLLNESLKGNAANSSDDFQGQIQAMTAQQQPHMQPYILSNGQLIPVMAQQPNQQIQILSSQTAAIPTMQANAPTLIQPQNNARKQPTLKSKPTQLLATAPIMANNNVPLAITDRSALDEAANLLLTDTCAKKHRAIRPKPSNATVITGHLQQHHHLIQPTTINTTQTSTTDDILAKAASMIFSPNEFSMQTSVNTTSPVKIEPVGYQLKTAKQQQLQIAPAPTKKLKMPKKSDNLKNSTVASLTSSTSHIDFQTNDTKQPNLIQIDLLNDSMDQTNTLMEAQKLLESLTNAQTTTVNSNSTTATDKNQTKGTQLKKKKRSKSPETISMPLLDEFFSIGDTGVAQNPTESAKNNKIDLQMNKKDLKDLYATITSPAAKIKKKKPEKFAKTEVDLKTINLSLTPNTSSTDQSSSQNNSAVAIPEQIEFEFSEIDKVIDQVESIHGHNESKGYGITLGDLNDDMNENYPSYRPHDTSKIECLNTPKLILPKKTKSKEFLSTSGSDTSDSDSGDEEAICSRKELKSDHVQRPPLKPENSQHQRKRGRPPKNKSEFQNQPKKQNFNEIDILSDEYDDLTLSKIKNSPATDKSSQKKARGRPKKLDANSNQPKTKTANKDQICQMALKSTPIKTTAKQAPVVSPPGLMKTNADDTIQQCVDMTLASLASPKRKRGRPTKLVSPLKPEFNKIDAFEQLIMPIKDPEDKAPAHFEAFESEKKETHVLDESQLDDSTEAETEADASDDQLSKRKYYGSGSDLSDSCVTTIAALTADAKPFSKNKRKKCSRSTKTNSKTSNSIKNKKSSKQLKDTKIRDNEYAGLTRFETNFTKILANSVNSNTEVKKCEYGTDELQTVVDSLKEKEAKKEEIDSKPASPEPFVDMKPSIEESESSEKNLNTGNEAFVDKVAVVDADNNQVDLEVKESIENRFEVNEDHAPHGVENQVKSIVNSSTDDLNVVSQSFDDMSQETVANECASTKNMNKECFVAPIKDKTPFEQQAYEPSYWPPNNVDAFATTQPQVHRHSTSTVSTAIHTAYTSSSPTTTTAAMSKPVYSKPTTTYSYQSDKRPDLMTAPYGHNALYYGQSSVNSFYPAASHPPAFHQQSEMYPSTVAHHTPSVSINRSKPIQTMPTATTPTKGQNERYPSAAPPNTIQLNSLFDTVLHQTPPFIPTSSNSYNMFNPGFSSDLYNTTTSQLQQQTKSSTKSSKVSTNKSKKTQPPQQQPHQQSHQQSRNAQTSLSPYDTNLSSWYDLAASHNKAEMNLNNIFHHSYGTDGDQSRQSRSTNASAAYLANYSTGSNWTGSNARSHAAMLNAVSNSNFPFINMDSTHNPSQFNNQVYNYQSYANNHGQQTYAQDFFKLQNASSFQSQHQATTSAQNHQLPQQHATNVIDEQRNSTAALRHHFQHYAPINLLAQNQASFPPAHLNWPS
jgi:hypothetical protein